MGFGGWGWFVVIVGDVALEAALSLVAPTWKLTILGVARRAEKRVRELKLGTRMASEEQIVVATSPVVTGTM